VERQEGQAQYQEALTENRRVTDSLVSLIRNSCT